MQKIKANNDIKEERTFYDPKEMNLYLDNQRYDSKAMNWIPADNIPMDLNPLSDEDAIRLLQSSRNKIKIPIAVIGANSPDEKQYATAEKIGGRLANLGLTVICGGRAGVMEAVCKGVESNNGISIGILPEDNINSANEFVTIPLASGVGFARNAIIVSSALCVIAIGGGNGTLSEIAYGLQFGKKVFSINCNLEVKGLVQCACVDEIIKNVCGTILKI